ncbi:MAG: CbiX/SirB N-terminal domain-containing protein [Burkholderiaceae bacterium]
MAPEGLLLFAHGARDAAWAAPFEEVARRIAAARPGLPLRLAYLEFMAPTIAEAAHALADAGCTRVHIVPMFLGTGGHVRRDIPPLIEQLRARYGSGVDWRLQAPLGEQEAVLQAMTVASLGWLNVPEPQEEKEHP